MKHALVIRAAVAAVGPLSPSDRHVSAPGPAPTENGRMTCLAVKEGS
jgi:hypothetical protein